ncbi:unnamed protein product, partial [marine sediment metagenome]
MTKLNKLSRKGAKNAKKIINKHKNQNIMSKNENDKSQQLSNLEESKIDTNKVIIV